MKKILMICFLAVMLASCQTYLPSPVYIPGGVDYSALTDRGIFVTESNSVSFDYEPIGSVYVNAYGGWVRKDGKPREDDSKEDYYILGSSSKKVYQLPSYEECFIRLAEKLNEMGANGIINLKFNWSKSVFDQTIDNLYISGMAIKK